MEGIRHTAFLLLTISDLVRFMLILIFFTLILDLIHEKLERSLKEHFAFACCILSHVIIKVERSQNHVG